jgi:cation diffusion facilitator family transporter
MAGPEGSTKAIAAAFGANTGIALAKFVGFLVTGSSALLAESIHSVADASNQGLLFLGGRRARRAPTTLHPFGYGRERYFWSFVVAIVLFLLGGVFSIYEAFHKIRDPHEITSPVVAFAILGIAMVFEAFALRTAMREARPYLAGRGWIHYIRTSRSPELPVLLLEDSGALLGLVFASGGIALALLTGNPVYDGIGTLAIGILLVAIAAVLALEMKSLLLGESAAPEMAERIERELAQTRGVRSVLHVMTQHMGPDDLLVAAALQLDPGLGGERLTRTLDDAEARIRAAVPIARLIYLEPDLPDEAPPEDAP